LEEKYTLLRTLDESILAECNTDKIENEIVEAGEVTDRIIQLRAEINSVLPKGTKEAGVRICQVEIRRHMSRHSHMSH